MKKITLVCSAGMSTSLLVKAMKQFDVDNEYQIVCCDVICCQSAIIDSDILLLAPHISYLKEQYEKKCQENHIPLMIIDTHDYAKLNGKEILKKAEDILKIYHKKHPFTVTLLHNSGGVMSDLIKMDMMKKLKDEEKEWIIESISIENYDFCHSDLILLEPHISFEKKNIEKRLNNQKIVLLMPSLSLYSHFNGRIVLDYIHENYPKSLENLKNKMKETIKYL